MFWIYVDFRASLLKLLCTLSYVPTEKRDQRASFWPFYIDPLQISYEKLIVGTDWNLSFFYAQGDIKAENTVAMFFTVYVFQRHLPKILFPGLLEEFFHGRM